MNPFNTDRFIAAIFCVSAGAAFALGQPTAEAATVFPPAHLAHGAAFAPAATTPAALPRGPWYRPQEPAATVSADDVQAGTPVAAVVTAAPWYRAAN
ncbi:MAG: hypothetical protein RLW62_15430 [Gammaproteobacteria bacterium]